MAIVYRASMKIFGAIWGIGGFVALLLFALYRLTPNTLAAWSFEWQWWHWVVFVVNLSLMAYYEGYKGFQRGYSPRVAARACYLLENGSTRDCLLAPLFCMTYYAGPARRIKTTWILTVFITAMIILFQFLPQPMRGILDAGVLLGLSWGLLATLFACWQVFSDGVKVDAEVLQASSV